MSTETIDELIVRLGLDASQFTAGQKQAAASLVDLKTSVAESAEGMSASIASVLGKFSAFTLGVAGLAGAADLVKNMAFEFKQLDIQSEALGSSFRTLRTMQEFSELTGAPKDALANYAQSGLSSLYGLVYGGLTPLYAQSALLGYGLGELPEKLATAKAPQQEESVWMDLLSRVQRYSPTWANPDPDHLPQSVNTAQTLQNVLGLPQPMAVALSKGEAFNTKLWDAAIAGNESATEKEADAATRAANAMIELRYGVENLAARGFGPLDTAIKAASGLLKDFNKGLDIVNNVLKGIENSKTFKFIEKEFVLPAMGAPPKESDNPLVKFWNIVGPGAGNKVGLEARTAVDHFFHTHDILGDIGNFIGAGFPVVSTPEQLLEAGIIASLPPIAPLKLPPFVPQALPLPPSLGALHSSMAGGAQHDDHSLTIGNMTIHTQATDANGVAAGMHAAVARKFNVSEADSGVTQ